MTLLDRAGAWLTARRHATVSWALLRILLGVTVLGILAAGFPHRRYVWGEGGDWLAPMLTESSVYPRWVSFWFVGAPPWLFETSYAVLAALAVAFTLGWRTRWVTPALLWLFTALTATNVLVLNGGDTLTRLALFLACFADVSARLSLDARRRRRRRGSAQSDGSGEPGAKAPDPTAGANVADPVARARAARLSLWGVVASNVALLLAWLQLTLTYVSGAIIKLQGEDWRDGSASERAIGLEAFQPLPWLSDALLATPLPAVATLATLILQGLFPLLILWRPVRLVTLALLACLHLGIGLVLGLWPFSLAAIALELLLVSDATWARWRSRRHAHHAETDGAFDAARDAVAAREGEARREEQRRWSATPAGDGNDHAVAAGAAGDDDALDDDMGAVGARPGVVWSPPPDDIAERAIRPPHPEA